MKETLNLMHIVLFILLLPFLQQCSLSTNAKEQALHYFKEIDVLNTSEIDTIYDNKNSCEDLYFRHFKKIDKDKYIEVRWSKKTTKPTDKIFVGEVLFIGSQLESITAEFTLNPFTIKSAPQKSLGPLMLSNKIKTLDSCYIYIYTMSKNDANLGKVQSTVCFDEKVGLFFTKEIFEKNTYYNDENTTFICGKKFKNEYITSLLSKIK
jgi:hypothetical protein